MNNFKGGSKSKLEKTRGTKFAIFPILNINTCCTTWHVVLLISVLNAKPYFLFLDNEDNLIVW